MLNPSWIAAFDAAVGDPVRAARTPLLTSYFYLCTLLANTITIVALTTAVVIVLAIRRRVAEAVLVVVVVAGGQALSTITKVLVARERPPASGALIPLPGDHSFPSGHSFAGLLLYGVLAFLLVRSLHSRGARIAVIIAAAVLIGSIGLSRVYLGVHWPSDVLGAWVLGGAWLAACCALYLRVGERGGPIPGTPAPKAGR
jgi:undecaprenyl-diphosphatase